MGDLQTDEKYLSRDGASPCATAEERRNRSLSTHEAPGQSECVSHGENQGLFSSKMGWGGARPNSGGARANSGGARPGSGPKRKAAITAPPRPSGPRWYCAVVAYQHELLVLRDLLDMGFDAHCPLVVEDDQLIRRLAYPGYVFVQFNAADPAWARIDEPPRCRLMAEADGTPTPVSRGYVEGLLAAAEGLGYIDARPDAASGLSIGAAVRIADGPLAGFTGRVIQTAGKWVKVTASILGHATPVTLPRSAVESIA